MTSEKCSRNSSTLLSELEENPWVRTKVWTILRFCPMCQAQSRAAVADLRTPKPDLGLHLARFIRIQVGPNFRRDRARVNGRKNIFNPERALGQHFYNPSIWELHRPNSGMDCPMSNHLRHGLVKGQRRPKERFYVHNARLISWACLAVCSSSSSMAKS